MLVDASLSWFVITTSPLSSSAKGETGRDDQVTVCVCEIVNEEEQRQREKGVCFEFNDKETGLKSSRKNIHLGSRDGRHFYIST